MNPRTADLRRFCETSPSVKVFRTPPKKNLDMNLQRLLDTGWKLAIILCSSVLMLAAFRSPQSPSLPTAEVRAQRFVLVDAEGKTLGEWGPDMKVSGGTAFVLYNRGIALTEALALRAADGKAELEVRGGQDNGAVMLGTDRGSSSVRLYDNCLDGHSNGIHLSCLAEIAVGQCTSQLRLEQVRREHADGAHTEYTEDVLRLPETKASRTKQPGK